MPRVSRCRPRGRSSKTPRARSRPRTPTRTSRASSPTSRSWHRFRGRPAPSGSASRMTVEGRDRRGRVGGGRRLLAAPHRRGPREGAARLQRRVDGGPRQRRRQRLGRRLVERIRAQDPYRGGGSGRQVDRRGAPDVGRRAQRRPQRRHELRHHREHRQCRGGRGVPEVADDDTGRRRGTWRRRHRLPRVSGSERGRGIRRSGRLLRERHLRGLRRRVSRTSARGHGVRATTSPAPR